MSRKIKISLGVCLVLGAGLLLAARGTGDTMDVQVLNFPDPQRIKGVVTIEGPIRHADLVHLPDIIVPPIKPADTTHLISAGTLATDGYTKVVLSLNGLTKGDVVKGGTVGAFLLPDEDSIVRTFNEAGQIQFPLEIAAKNVAATSAYFASSSERLNVGFPRYRVLLYNTTDKTATVNLFAYLTD
jgi:hypothetical protein